MKIIATSDLHGDLSGFDPSGASVVLIAGDFAELKGRGVWHIYDQKKWIVKKFFPFCASYPDVMFVVVPGNHDMCLDRKYTGAGATPWGIDWRLEPPPNVRILVDETFEFDGFRMYGTPWVPVISRSWAFEGEPRLLKEKFGAVPEGLDALIVHTPPRIPGSTIDVSVGRHEMFGSPELAQAILEKRPRFVFCGHIHTGDHSRTVLGTSEIYNVSRVDESYEIAYEPLTLDI